MVEVIGGIVTAHVLGPGAAFLAASQRVRNHDDRIDDLYEDNRRWFRDRSARLAIDLDRLSWEHAERGVGDSSIAEGAKLAANTPRCTSTAMRSPPSAAAIATSGVPRDRQSEL